MTHFCQTTYVVLSILYADLCVCCQTPPFFFVKFCTCCYTVSKNNGRAVTPISGLKMNLCYCCLCCMWFYATAVYLVYYNIIIVHSISTLTMIEEHLTQSVYINDNFKLWSFKHIMIALVKIYQNAFIKQTQN